MLTIIYSTQGKAHDLHLKLDGIPSSTMSHNAWDDFQHSLTGELSTETVIVLDLSSDSKEVKEEIARFNKRAPKAALIVYSDAKYNPWDFYQMKIRNLLFVRKAKGVPNLKSVIENVIKGIEYECSGKV